MRLAESTRAVSTEYRGSQRIRSIPTVILVQLERFRQHVGYLYIAGDLP